jgi:predicted DNA binding CopG/RHH family protein
MRKDAVYRMRVSSRTLAAIKKGAGARGEAGVDCDGRLA